MIKKEVIIDDNGHVFLDGKREEWFGASSIGLEVHENGITVKIEVEKEMEHINEWGN